jgi:hypothetical protein
MKCHYVYDKIAGKVLIPGCMGVAVHQDKSYCTCSVKYKEPLEYKVLKLEQTVKDLRKEIKNLKL